MRTRNENKLYRAMNQLERIRRIRQGEQLAAPAALDVSVHSEGTGMDSTGAVPNLVLEGSQFKASTEVASANGKGEQDPPEVSESTGATEEPD